MTRFKEASLSERHHLDGKPFYCAKCGLGLREYYACEEPYCELESHAKAKQRRINYEEGMERSKRMKQENNSPANEQEDSQESQEAQEDRYWLPVRVSQGYEVEYHVLYNTFRHRPDTPRQWRHERLPWKTPIPNWYTSEYFRLDDLLNALQVLMPESDIQLSYVYVPKGEERSIGPSRHNPNRIRVPRWCCSVEGANGYGDTPEEAANRVLTSMRVKVRAEKTK